jgi:hypothetical protein
MHINGGTPLRLPKRWEYATLRMNEALRRYLAETTPARQDAAMRWAMAWRAAAELSPHHTDRPDQSSRG